MSYCRFFLSEAAGNRGGTRTRALNLERRAGWTEEKHDAASESHLQIESGARIERRLEDAADRRYN
jgi:hypothetical protein